MLVEKANDDNLGGIDPKEQSVRELGMSDPPIRIRDHVECFRERGELFHRALKLRENALGKFRTLVGIPSDGFIDLSQTRVDESRVHFTNLARRASCSRTKVSMGRN